MKVLVINCGSSSIKYRLFEMPEEKLLAEGLLEKIGKEDSRLIHNTDKGKYNINKPVKNHKEGLKLIIDVLSDEKIGVVKDIAEIKEEISRMRVKKTNQRLEQNWRNIKSVMPVSSGGLHPGHVPFLIKHLGKDLVIQAGGGIHGHPFGTKAGAIAMRQVVDAVLKKKSLKEYAKNHVELEEALEQWC